MEAGRSGIEGGLRRDGGRMEGKSSPDQAELREPGALEPPEAWNRCCQSWSWPAAPEASPQSPAPHGHGHARAARRQCCALSPSVLSYILADL